MGPLAAIGFAAPALAILAPAGLLGPPRDTLDELAAKLSSRNKWERAEAVEDLAALRTGAAWELVLGALADPKGEVADAAQWSLAGIEDLEPLFGRAGLCAKDPWVRRRVAELLGRTQVAPAARALLRALDDPDPEVRRMLLWSIERRGASWDGPCDAIERAARRDRDPGVQARGLLALAAIDRERAQRAVREAGQDRAPAVRCGAAAALPLVFDADVALAALRPLAADPERAVRTQAAESIAALGTRAAALELASRLGREEEEHAAWRLVGLLQGMSGLFHRRDPRPWLDWANALAADWRAPLPKGMERGGIESGREEAGATSAGSLLGLPILSRRLAFLIDLSGSIWFERTGGTTRKQIVDQRLRAVLESLPTGTRFNVIPYTGEPIPFVEHLVPATPANRDRAARFFEQRAERGPGAFWEAAMLALADPDVDTLVVLSDGAPTGGRHHRLELIVALYLEGDLTRKVAVDSILVDPARKAERTWRELALRTGGRSISISLDGKEESR
jgi:HEAT repeat protein